MTELGDIELKILRTRRKSALEVIRAYARRARDINRLILACFVLGLSTRKASKALLPILGEPISPTTVSQAAKWFRKVAEQRDAEAQFNLGAMYYKGRGVPQDYVMVMAHMWDYE